LEYRILPRKGGGGGKKAAKFNIPGKSVTGNEKANQQTGVIPHGGLQNGTNAPVLFEPG
jgi:hypothetical protein